MKIKVINKSNNPLPTYATIGSAGMDVKCDLTEVRKNPSCLMGSGCDYDEVNDEIIMFSGSRCAVPTGLKFNLPKGCELQVRGRSGLAIKKGILAHFGTLDSDYTGELKVILFNLSNEPFYIKEGDRIGQVILNKYQSIEWEEVKELSETERGEGGFGSTGNK